MKAFENIVVSILVLCFSIRAADADSGSDSGGKATIRPEAGREKADTVFVLRQSDSSDDDAGDSSDKDTVLVLTREGTQDFLTSFKGQVRNTRERGYGGALGPSLGVFAVHLKPVRDVIQRFPDLRRVGFQIYDGYYIFVMMGGMGYGGLGNGLRIGGGGRGGSREFTHVLNDTTYTLDVGVGYGGFLIEKAFVRRDLNFNVGTFLGGGGMDMTVRKYAGTSAFGTSDDYEPEQGAFDAGFMLIELHGGVTYSLLTWMHIGLDASIPAYLSPSGFKRSDQVGVTDGFFTVNPGVRMRIMFGNLG